MGDLEVTVLGNCSNHTDAYEATNFLVNGEEKTVLIDAGPGVVGQVMSTDYDITDIDAIVITHSHGDHTLGYPYVLFSNFYERFLGGDGPSEISLITTDDLEDGLSQMVSFCYPPGEFEQFSINHRSVSMDEETEFDVGAMKITTVPVTHAVPAFGLRIDVGSASITISGDTVYDERLVDLASNSDMLFHEAMAPDEMSEGMANVKHGIAREAGKAASEASVRRLGLLHLLPNYRKDPSQLVTEAKEEFEGDVVVPEELSTYSL